MNNKIQIDGEKLKNLLESVTGKSLVEIALENGFSKDFFRNVIRRGEASPNVQAVVRLYGIEPSAYEKKADIKITCEPKTDAKQLSIDDLITDDARDVLKAVIKEALIEVLSSASCAVVKGVTYEPEFNRFKLTVYKEDTIQCKRA